MNLNDWLQLDHGTNRTNICRTIADMPAAQPVRPVIARAKQLPNVHDVSAVELVAALSAWLQSMPMQDCIALARDCWGNDEQEG